MKKVKYSLKSTKASPPRRANKTDAGTDLTAISIEKKQSSCGATYYMSGTGIAVEIPPGMFGLLVPRSSAYKKFGLQMTSPGIIDADYRGEVFVPVTFVRPHVPECILGEKIAQLIILPCATSEWEKVAELGDTERGEGGFGSTDTKVTSED